MTLEVGNLVKFKYDMVIERIESTSVTCSWVDEEGLTHNKLFSLDSLELTDETLEEDSLIDISSDSEEGEVQHGKDIVEWEGIKAFSPSNPGIQELLRDNEIPEMHGNKVWDSCYALLDFLKQFVEFEDNLSVLDIGCGWGVMSCYLAKKYNALVIGIDADKNVEPFFQYHVEKNKTFAEFQVDTIGSVSDTDICLADVIVGADICFWDELADDWIKLIDRAVEDGTEHIYLADPGRDPFLKVYEYCKNKYGSELYSHTIEEPYPVEAYILDVIP